MLSVCVLFCLFFLPFLYFKKICEYNKIRIFNAKVLNWFINNKSKAAYIVFLSEKKKKEKKTQTLKFLKC